MLLFRSCVLMTCFCPAGPSTNQILCVRRRAEHWYPQLYWNFHKGEWWRDNRGGHEDGGHLPPSLGFTDINIHITWTSTNHSATVSESYHMICEGLGSEQSSDHAELINYLPILATYPSHLSQQMLAEDYSSAPHVYTLWCVIWSKKKKSGSMQIVCIINVKSLLLCLAGYVSHGFVSAGIKWFVSNT